jgi:hypothetical protein
MGKKTIHPYQNEKECLQINDLTIENRTDRLSIYGNLDLTRDKEGLAAARMLKEVIDQTVAALEQEDLPEKIVLAAVEIVDNPFK